MMREAVILAGGFGTRLQSVVPDLPKPMAPVADRPFLEYLLDFLIDQRFTRVVLSLGYKADLIRNYFGPQYRSLDIAYVTENSPLGTGGAIKSALLACHGEPVFIFNGDSFIEIECTVLLNVYRKTCRPVIVGRHVDNASRYGRLVIEGPLVCGISEKSSSESGIINAGCYVVPRNLLDDYGRAEKFSFETDFLMPTLAMKPFALHIANGRFIDIGVPDDYRRAHHLLATSVKMDGFGR